MLKPILIALLIASTLMTAIFGAGERLFHVQAVSSLEDTKASQGRFWILAER